MSMKQSQRGVEKKRQDYLRKIVNFGLEEVKEERMVFDLDSRTYSDCALFATGCSGRLTM